MSQPESSAVLEVNAGNPDRISSFDYVKAFAILAVVIIHAAPFGSFAAQGGGFDFLFIALNGMARFGVPCFFAVSGYLFGRKLMATPSFGTLKRFLLRIAKIYGLSVVLYLVVYWLFYKTGVSGPVDMAEFSALSLIYYGPYHLWFLTSLFYSILIASFFYYMRLLPVLLAIGGVLFLFGLFGQSYRIFWSIDIQTRDCLFFGLFFVTMGMVAATFPGKILKHISNQTVFIFFSLTLLLQAVEAYMLRGMGAAPGNYYLSTAFCSFFLLLLAVRCPEWGKGSAFVDIGKKTLGIFIIHPLLMKMTAILLDHNDADFYTQIAWQVLYPLLIILTSYAVVRLCSRYSRFL